MADQLEERKPAAVAFVCLFCCKTVHSLKNDLLHKRKTSYHQFFTFLERYFGNGKTFCAIEAAVTKDNNDNPAGDCGVCGDCEGLTRNICDLYHQFKCTELQIQDRVQTLLRVIKQANRVPSRLISARQIFSRPTDLKDFMKTRRQLVRECTNGITKRAPQVALTRITNSTSNTPDNLNLKLENSSVSENINVTWLLSLAAVFIIQQLNAADEVAATGSGESSTEIDPNIMENQSSSEAEETFFNLENNHICTNTPPGEFTTLPDKLDLCNNNVETENETRMQTYEAISTDNMECEPVPNNTICEPGEVTSEGNLHMDCANVKAQNFADTPAPINAIEDFEEIDDAAENVSSPNTPSIHEKNTTSFCKKEPSVNQQDNDDENDFEITTNLDLHEPSTVTVQCKQEPRKGERKRKLCPGKTAKEQKYVCKLCKLSFLTYTPYLIHCKSSGHMRRIRRTSNKATYVATRKLDKNIGKNTRITTELDLQSKPSILFQLLTKKPNLQKPTSKPQQSSESSSSSSSSEEEDDRYKPSNSDYSSSSSSSYSDTDPSDSEPETAKPKHKPRQKRYKVKSDWLYCPERAWLSCTFRTKNKWLLKEHEVAHRPGKFSCAFCNKILNTAIQLAEHELQKHSKPRGKPYSKTSTKYSCPRCSYTQSYKQSCIRHFIRQHVGCETFYRQRCSICQVLVRSTGLEKHIRVCHNISKMDSEKVVRCQEPNCSAYFTTKIKAERHNYIHKHGLSAVLFYQCVLCKQKFGTLTALNKHKKCKHETLTNPEIPIFKSSSEDIICPKLKCREIFDSVEELRKHLQLHGEYKCNFCDSVHNYATSLSLHEMTHGRKFNTHKFNCQRCYFGSDDRQTYIDHHLLCHLKLYLCTMCGESFVSNDKLKIHETEFHSHNSISCTQCTAYFVKEWQLLRHRQLQHMPKYKCQVEKCHQEFTFQFDLQRHQNLHETMSCKFCSEQFDFVQNLALHELEHEPGNKVDSGTLKCPRCSTKFGDAKSYVFHFVGIHLCLSPDMHRCDICEKVLVPNAKPSTESQIPHHHRQYHSIEHIDPATVQRCDQCPAYFISCSQLEFHKDQMHQENSLMCKICKLDFSNSNACIAHKKLHNEFKCQFCNAIKYYAGDLAIHELLQHGQITENGDDNIMFYNCARCKNLPFGSLYHYSRHFLDNHLDLSNKVPCTVCELQYADKYLLARHMKKFHNVNGIHQSKIVKCNKCPAYFLTKMQLAAHKKRAHGKAHVCKKCDKMFGTETLLLNHKLTHKPKDQWNHKCAATGCSEAFPTKYMLNTHMRSHSESEYKFVCNVPNCGKMLPTEKELDIHIKYDTNNAHFKDSGFNDTIEEWRKEIVICDLCGKEFSRMGLRTHVTAAHLKDPCPKEFKCDKCEKTFKQKAQLQTHQEFHKGPEQWKFMCSTCSRRFPFKSNLEQHMRTHTKEKPFVCQICGEKYAHRHNLRNHVNTKHKVEGVQDIAMKRVKRFYVSRKGKKLKGEYCFTREQDNQ